MFKKLGLLFAVLTIISSGAANADVETVAYADIRGSEHNEVEQFIVKRMDEFLNKDLYEIQQETSKIEFRVNSPIGDVWANFQNFEGSFAMLNSGAHSDPASIVINAESLDTDSGFIGMLLRSESFFDIENFPSMRFVGSSFKWISGKRAILKGYMTIKNVTRQVAFYIDLDDTNIEDEYSERVTVKASTTIRRSEFGIYTLLPAVSDDVNLFMSIDAIKKKNTALSMM